MIKTLAHQINEHYLDLSKRLKKVEERVISGVETGVAKVVQPLKEELQCVHKDVKAVRTLVQNIKERLESSENEDTELEEESPVKDHNVTK